MQHGFSRGTIPAVTSTCSLPCGLSSDEQHAWDADFTNGKLRQALHEKCFPATGLQKITTTFSLTTHLRPNWNYATIVKLRRPSRPLRANSVPIAGRFSELVNSTRSGSFRPA